MIYVGIDVSKDKHDCHILDCNGIVWHDNLSFSNSKEGFENFETIVNNISQKTNQSVKIALEDTGHYSTNLIAFLRDKDFAVFRYNALIVSNSKKSLTLRKTKTDKSDARYIATQLITSQANLERIISKELTTLKSLTRARFRLVGELQPIKNRYRRLIWIVFPELEQVFNNLHINTVLELLKKYPSAKQISKCKLDSLSTFLRKHSYGKHQKNTAEKLISFAKNSIAFYNEGDSFELSLLVKKIIFFNDQIKELEAQIISIIQSINSPITTITGIGNITGATILAEIGDIKAFSKPSKLLSFAGCEPNTYESGKYVASKTPMVKRGSRYLRTALYQATYAAYINNKEIRSYINKKRAEGKHFYTAMIHGIKKMTRIIFAVLTQNIPYKNAN